MDMWLNFGKSTILAHLTNEIFSSQKQPINLKFYAMIDWVHSRYIKNLRNTQKAFCIHGSANENSNCFMHNEMVDFPKFGHICNGPVNRGTWVHKLAQFY